MATRRLVPSFSVYSPSACNHSPAYGSSLSNLLAICGRLQVDGELPRFILYHHDFPFQKLTNPWLDTAGAVERVFVVQTNTKVVERCVLMTTDPGDLVLDPTCGSGTTAYVSIIITEVFLQS
ncbi:hypothetical protein ES705_44993 [subsurface metagenome]